MDSLTISTNPSDTSCEDLPSPLFTLEAFSPKPYAKPTTGRRTPIKIEGHRGAGLLEPENTLKAFQRAIDLEIDGVELDVWLSKDGIPIVVHGTEDGLVHFKDTSLTTMVVNVHSKDLKDWKLPNDETIPTLEEVLLLCKGKIKVNIELKEENERIVKPTLGLVIKMDMLDQVVFSSFLHTHKDKLEEVKRELNVANNLEFGFLVWQLQDFSQYVHKAMSGDCLSIDIELLMKHEAFILEEISKAREKQMKIKFYFGFEIDENDTVYRKLEDLKVDTLIINHPLKTLDFVNSPIYF